MYTVVLHCEASLYWSATRLDCWTSLFNSCINDIAEASSKIAFILYADDTTLNSTLDLFGSGMVWYGNILFDIVHNIIENMLPKHKNM